MKQGQDFKVTEMISLSENVAKKAIKKTSQDFLNFTEDHLSRIYPNATRINSVNFSPAFYWLHGCQMVALNYQTSGGEYWNCCWFASPNLLFFPSRFPDAAQYCNVQTKWRLWLCSQARGLEGEGRGGFRGGFFQPHFAICYREISGGV